MNAVLYTIIIIIIITCVSIRTPIGELLAATQNSTEDLRDYDGERETERKERWEGEGSIGNEMGVKGRRG